MCIRLIQSVEAFRIKTEVFQRKEINMFPDYNSETLSFPSPLACPVDFRLNYGLKTVTLTLTWISNLPACHSNLDLPAHTIA